MTESTVSKGKVKTCRNCSFGNFPRTETGRIRNVAGDCHYPIAPQLLPWCCRRYKVMTKCSIWPSDGKGCLCFQERP